MKKNKIAFAIGFPILILLCVFGIGGFLKLKAGSEDFVVSNGILTKYAGSDSVVKIPLNVSVIGQEAFSGNSSIVNVEIPASVTRIDNNAFSNCVNLQSIIIPDSVSAIGESAFNGDAALTTVVAGKSLASIGSGAFAGCSNLASIAFQNSNFICENGCVYNATKTRLIQYLAGYPGNVYNMPDTVSDIERYCFWGADKLNEINLSGSLTRIPEYSMANCKSLMNVKGNLPLREIGLGAFHGDSSLLQVVMPDSMINIHTNSFDGCPSDMIFVCADGTYASGYASEHGFLVASEPQVSVTNNNLTVVSNNQSTQNNSNNSNQTLNNPTASGNNLNDLYGQLFGEEDNNNNYNVNNYSNNVVSTVTNDDVNGSSSEKPFKGYDYIEEEGASRVAADRAFVSLDNLSVVDGSTLDSKDSSVGIPQIKDYQYYNSGSFETNIPSDTKRIGVLSYARSSLKKVVIPEGVETIGYAAFYHCDSLEDVVIPTTVKTIDEHAFEFTPWLTNWYNDENTGDYLIVGDGILLAYKGTPENFKIPDNIKFVCKDLINQ